MIKSYRLASPRHDPRTGLGAAKWGGRWNSPGYRVLYTSSSLALACLEVLVHIQDTTNMPPYAYWELTIPEWAITKWVPEDNFVLSSQIGTRALGNAWLGYVPKGDDPGPLEPPPRLDERNYLRCLAELLLNIPRKLLLIPRRPLLIPRRPLPVQQVPSLIIPQEWNYLIAPEHVQFDAIQWSEPKPFAFDQRLLPPCHDQTLDDG